MENTHEWALEVQHLRQVLNVAQAQYDKAARGRSAHADALREAEEELLERGSMDMGGFGSTQGFADMLERSGDMMRLHESRQARDEIDRQIMTLARMLDAPYFARIDFQGEGGDVREVYIGRATLMETSPMRFFVYDWRTPIASVFYQFGPGPARYDAPGGRIEGNVLRKRQYEIRRGSLQYFFDADAQVSDAFLRQMLAKPSAPSMKGIVETIQRDQDRIIRDLQSSLLMVQGTAGSGKTSVALHRVAYLMYEGLKANRVAPEEMLILAPNATFERYIEQVLPDLGQQQVRTMLLGDILQTLLPDAGMQPRGAWVEALLSAPDAQRKAMRTARALQGCSRFLTLLDRLADEIAERWTPFADIWYGGQCVMQAEAMREDICAGGKLAPVGIRLQMLETQLWRKIHAMRPKRMEALLHAAKNDPLHHMEAAAYARMYAIAESGALLAHMRAFTQVDCAVLYRKTIADEAAFARLSQGLFTDQEADMLRQSASCGILSYGDAVAVAYLQAKVYGCRTFHSIRQLVVDEVQDFSALQMGLLRLLFPRARYTMLGDRYQALDGPPDAALYGMISDVLQRPDALLMTLDKSFRCTREIWDFSAQFLPESDAGESFSRTGDPVMEHGTQSAAEMEDALLAEIALCREKGHRSIACLCRTEADARALHEAIGARADARLIANDDLALVDGVAVLPLYMAKGLEFDAVLLCDVDATHYHDAADQGLLYVGCTRALHRLSLFWHGEKSPLVKEGGTRHGV